VGRFRRLDDALRAGDFEALRAQLGGVDDFPNVDAGPGIGPCLTYAIYHSPLSLVIELLDSGADPDWPSDDGFPPLIAALSCSDAAPGVVVRSDVHDLLTTLLAHGADVGQRGLNDYTALHWATAQGDGAAVEILLASGADPNAITHIDDLETPLEVARAAGHVDIVERLTPLTTRLSWQQASQVGDVAGLRRMLGSGHDIEAIDGYGQTALMRAAHGGHAEAVEWLIARGANLDHTSKFHLSALTLAVIAGHGRVARLLVAAGADTRITGTGAPGFHGKTAADMALDRGDKRLAAFIGNHGRAVR
jgi:uncharacterized protein